VDEPWATINVGAGSGVDRANDCPMARASTTNNQYQYDLGGIFCFDTNILTNSARISDVKFSPFSTSTTPVNALGDSPFHVVAATPGSTSGIVAADYSQLGTISFGNKTKASWSTSAYNDITLDAKGRANINKTGISKFGAVLGFKLSGSPTWASALDTAYYIYFSDQAGTSNDPKLTVTYTRPGPELLTIL
jgi:hypothetical protein